MSPGGIQFNKQQRTTQTETLKRKGMQKDLINWHDIWLMMCQHQWGESSAFHDSLRGVHLSYDIRLIVYSLMMLPILRHLTSLCLIISLPSVFPAVAESKNKFAQSSATIEFQYLRKTEEDLRMVRKMKWTFVPLPIPSLLFLAFHSLEFSGSLHFV